VSQFPNRFQITWLRFHDTNVLKDRLHDQTGRGVAFDNILYRGQVVEVDHMDERFVDRRYPGRTCIAWIFSRTNPVANVGQGPDDSTRYISVPSVVPPLHHGHVVTAGYSPCQTNSVVGGFRPGGSYLETFGGRHGFDKKLSKLSFQ